VRYAKRIALWLAFLLPLGYVAMILAVTAHEVAGHGGTALLCGGEFHAFQIDADGGGRAWTDAPDHRIEVLAGGIAVEVLIGGILLAGAFLTRRRPLLCASLVVLAMGSLHDGLPYGLWNGIVACDAGDVGRILHLVDSATLRLTLVSGLAVAYVTTAVLTSLLLLRCLELDLGPLPPLAVVAIAGAITAGIGLGYGAYHWDALSPGAGQMPTYGAIALQAAVGVLLVLARRRTVVSAQVSPRAWCVAIPASWTACGLTIAALVLWLADGVLI
jgi:hypothetical protein